MPGGLHSTAVAGRAIQSTPRVIASTTLSGGISNQRCTREGGESQPLNRWYRNDGCWIHHRGSHQKRNRIERGFANAFLVTLSVPNSAATQIARVIGLLCARVRHPFRTRARDTRAGNSRGARQE